MIWVLLGLYGWLALVSLGNAVLLPRLRRVTGDSADLASLTFLIPARDEAENLSELLPLLVGHGAPVLVFDDESTDGTGDVARRLGAQVIRPTEPLPGGWTGKNRACHALALAATEAVEARYWVFLDADVRPHGGWVKRLRTTLAADGRRWPVQTGFSRMAPGAGLEPVYLSWVPWSLLASNPFGLVARTGLAHNGFTNGQVTAWRADVYTELWPHQMVRGEILEDVLIGRMLARKGIRVRVLNLSDTLTVRMYRTVGEAWRGMTKNAVDIAGPGLGTYIFAALMVVIALGWTLLGPLAWVGYGLLVLSKVATDRVARLPLWTAPFLPLSLLAAAATLVASAHQRRRGLTAWKGRTYPPA